MGHDIYLQKVSVTHKNFRNNKGALCNGVIQELGYSRHSFASSSVDHVYNAFGVECQGESKKLTVELLEKALKHLDSFYGFYTEKQMILKALKVMKRFSISKFLAPLRYKEVYYEICFY